MRTELRIDGANCPICLGELLDQLRELDGVTSVSASIAAGCIAIDHADLNVDQLIGIARAVLRGVALSGDETVMTRVEPVRLDRRCRHAAAATPRPPSHAPDDDAETLSGGMNRLRRDGYEHDFSATVEGRLACQVCGANEDPATMHVDLTARYEGQSNPDDESILLAITCHCGNRGLFTAAYGTCASRQEALVLQGLER